MPKRRQNFDFVYRELPSKTSRNKRQQLSTQLSSKTHGLSVSDEPCHGPTVDDVDDDDPPQNVAEVSPKTSKGDSSHVLGESFAVSPIPLSPSPGLGGSRPSPRVGKSFYGDASPASQKLAKSARVVREKGDSAISTIMGDSWEQECGLCSDNDDWGALDGGGSSSSDDDDPGTAQTSHATSLDAKCTSTCSLQSIVGVLGEVCSCGKDCTAGMCRRDVEAARNATVVAARNRKLQDHTREKLLEVMHKSVLNNKTSFQYKFNGIDICNEAFRLVHGFSVPGMRNALAWCRADLSRRMDIDQRKINLSSSLISDNKDAKGLGGTERSLTAEQWISEYVTAHGCQMPDSDHIHIDNVPWLEIHNEYQLDTKDTVIPLEIGRFRGVWKKGFPNVRKRRRKPFGECAECAGFKAQLEEERRDPKQREITMKKYLAHIAHQKGERLGYYRRRAKGKRGRCISLIMDGMDQSKADLPHTTTSLKSDGNMVETKITGVLVHGRNFNCYVSEPQVKHDTNLSLTCLHDTLMEEVADSPADTLYLQVDGGSENKTQWAIAYFVLLISLGIFQKIKMCFLPVGHTHEDIDQGFSCIARHLRRVNAYTFAQLAKAVRESFKKEDKHPNVFQIGEAFEWKSFVSSPEVQAMSPWTDNHIYRFSWNPYHNQVQMHYKKWDKSLGYFGYHPSTFVKSFKVVEQEARKDPSAWDRHAGVLLGTKDKPEKPPGIARNIDFHEGQKTKSGKEG